MTYGKRQFENLDAVMRRLIPPFHQAMNELLHMVDADSSAFTSYMVSRTSRHQPPRAHAFISLEKLFVGKMCLLLLFQAALKMPKNTAEEIKRCNTFIIMVCLMLQVTLIMLTQLEFTLSHQEASNLQIINWCCQVKILR